VVARAQHTDQHRIVRDPKILAGKPVVAGTRIPVKAVLQYLANDPNFDNLFADYPRLSMEDVQACLEFAEKLVQHEGVRRPRTRGAATGS